MLTKKSGNIINMASVASSIKGKMFRTSLRIHVEQTLYLIEGTKSLLLKYNHVYCNPLISDNCFACVYV